MSRLHERWRRPTTYKRNLASEISVAKEIIETEVETSEAEFRVAEFAAVCAMAKEKSNGKPNFRKVESNFIMFAQGVSFKVIVDWFCHENGCPNPARPIGAYLEAFNPKNRQAKVRKRIAFVNTDPSCSCIQEDLFFDPFSGGRQGYSASLGPAVKGFELPLADFFDPDLGWLHDGALVVQVKVSAIDALKGSKSRLEKVDALRDGSREVCQSLKGLLSSGDFSDVTIQVGSEHLKAHSQILAVRSPFFQKALERSRHVQISDVPPETMKALLAFLYTGVLEPGVVEDAELLVSLLALSSRFEIAGLAQSCGKALLTRISVGNAVAVFDLADSLGLAELRAGSCKFLQSNDSVQKTEGFQQLAARKPELFQDPSNKKRRQN